MMALWMAASKGLFGSRCSRSWVNSCTVIGEHLGHLDVAGATLAVPVSAAFSCKSSMSH